MEPDPSAEQQIARLTLLAEARFLSAALAVVREAAASLGLPAADVTRLDRAVHEVASNVIEHGFDPGQRATFDLVVLRRPGQIVVAVEDAGLPFDFSDLEVGQGSSLAAPSLTGFADAFRFSSLGARGNRVEIVKRLPFYARGGLPRAVADAAGAVELGDVAQVAVEVFPVWSEAALRVTAYGRDLPDLVRFRLRELRLRRIDWISLDLPLSDPAARLACAPLEALGFFFAGIIPELDGDDVLRLQYLHDVEADVESVQIASDFGAELFAYVVAAMRGRPDRETDAT